MPRLPSRFTIAQLETMLQARRGQLDSLQRERNAAGEAWPCPIECEGARRWLLTKPS